MTRSRMRWALTGAVGVGLAFLGVPSAGAQEIPEEEAAQPAEEPGAAAEEASEVEVAGEAELSTEDLWADESADAEELEEAGEESNEPPWRGTNVAYAHEAALRPYLIGDESADPTYNPQYTHTLDLVPMWHFDEHWTLTGLASFSQELTNPDDRTGRYDVWVATRADLAYVNLWEKWGFALTPHLRAVFPTTPLQQAQSLYFALAPGFTVSRRFDVMKGLELGYTFRFAKNFHRYKEASSPPQFVSCESATDGDGCTTTSTGSRNTNLSLRNRITATLQATERLNFGLLADVGHALAYSTTPATMGDAVSGDHNGLVDEGELIEDNDARGGWRFTETFRLSAGYDFLSYLNADLSLGVTDGPQTDPASEHYNPFLPNRNTTAALTVTVLLDQFMKAVGPSRASGEGRRVARRGSQD